MRHKAATISTKSIRTEMKPLEMKMPEASIKR